MQPIDWVLSALILVLIGLLILWFVRGGFQGFARKPLIRCFKGLELHDQQYEGDVIIRYQTYRGFLIWLIQEDHHIATSPQEAKTLLRRLLTFNLTWGLLSYGAILVPLFAIPCYFAQLRSIDRQVANSSILG